MSYRFVKVTTFYDQYLGDFFARRPGLSAEPHAVQVRALLDDDFAWGDHYGRNLRAMGIDAHEIVANAAPVQRAWARENGLSDHLDERAIVMAQLAAIRPDVLFIESCNAHGGWIAEARSRVDSIRLVVGYHGSPHSPALLEKLRSMDLVLTCHAGFVADFRSAGIDAELLPHAFEPTVLDRMGERPPQDHDFVFVGSITLGPGMHAERLRLIEGILEAGIDLQFHGMLARESIRRRPWKILGRGPFSRALRERVAPPVFGVQMYRALASARVAFNNHGEAAGEYAANMRLFEATGVGTCLLTDSKKNLPELFAPDEEVVTYGSVAECVEKLRWLLDNPAHRAAVAAAGQRRVLNEHTYAQRMLRLDELIRGRL